MERNAELEQKLQMLLGEYAVMKSDCEIVKTKARQLLIEKDKEIAKIKAQRGIVDHGGEDLSGKDKSSKEMAAMGDSGASNFQETTELVLSQAASKPIAIEAQQFLQ